MIYFNKIECIIDSLMWVFLESDSVKWKKKKRFLWKNKQKILNELMRMLEELRERERERDIYRK